MARFKVLWILVRGLWSSMTILIWTFVLLGLVLYIFAVIGVEMHCQDWEPENQELVRLKFGSVPRAMLTLLQFTTLDTWHAVAQPLVYEKWYFVIYYVVFILISSIATMNLVTATIVQEAVEEQEADTEVEAHWQKQLRQKVAE